MRALKRCYESVSGIFDSENSVNILIQNNSNKEKLIKKGKTVGYINTLATVTEEENEEEWNLEKVKESIKVNHKNLNGEQKEQVYEMLLNCHTSLSKNSNDIGNALVTPHTIELTNETPIWQKPRTFAEPINQAIEEQCKDLLNNDIIEYSNSNWSSPVVPVRKSDGSLRLCIDYRRLNTVTKQQQFPMPNLNHCLYKASKINYFTKLDLVRGYYQIELDENSRDYTAFSTPNNHYNFKRLAFGLKNSGIAFQKACN